MSPVVQGEKGTHKELLDSLRKEGFIRVRINGETLDLSENIDWEIIPFDDDEWNFMGVFPCYGA